MPFTLRQDQQDLRAKLYTAIRSGFRRILMVAGTGFGKGVLEVQLALDALSKGRRVIVVTHREELLLDHAARLARETSTRVGIIKAGYPSDLTAMIQLASVQTMAARDGWKILLDDPAPILWLFEEAHRTTYFAAGTHVLETMRPQDIAIGATATPAPPAGGKPLETWWQTSIAGPLPHELMTAGHLCRFRHIGLKSPGKAGRRLDVDPKEDTTRALKLWRKVAKDRPTIAFCGGVDHACRTAEELTAMGHPAAAIVGTLDQDERKDLYARFNRREIHVLTSDEILTTGIDWPPLSCILLLATLGSWREHIQMLGRGSRPHPSKIETLVIDTAANVELHGALEDVRPEDYQMGTAGIRKARARRQCPSCTTIVAGPSCPCGHTWEVHARPILLWTPDRPENTPDRQIYTSCLRKAMANVYAPGQAIGVLKNIRGDGYTPPDDLALLTLYPDPTQRDLEQYHAYLLKVAARVQRKGGQLRDEGWVRREVEKQFGPGIDWQ